MVMNICISTNKRITSMNGPGWASGGRGIGRRAEAEGWGGEEDLARRQEGHVVALLRMLGSETRALWTDSRGVARQRAEERESESSTRGVIVTVTDQQRTRVS